MMIRLFVFLIWLVMVTSVCGQSVNVESMIGSRNYYYQHALFQGIGNSSFGFSHSSSLHAFYHSDNLNELMSQSYLTYPVARFARLAVGTFYASVPAVSPAVAFQFHYAKRDFKALWVPRIDFRRKFSKEIMMLLEYSPKLSDRVQFYSRVQLMTNYGPSYHNRSYQNFRVGLQANHTVMGFALNIDYRGKAISTLYNSGIFLRYTFNQNSKR